MRARHRAIKCFNQRRRTSHVSPASAVIAHMDSCSDDSFRVGAPAQLPIPNGETRLQQCAAAGTMTWLCCARRAYCDANRTQRKDWSIKMCCNRQIQETG